MSVSYSSFTIYDVFVLDAAIISISSCVSDRHRSRKPLYLLECLKLRNIVTTLNFVWFSINLPFLFRTLRPKFLIGIVGGGVQLGLLGTAATKRPIVPAPGDYDDGEIGGMIGRGTRSTRRKPAPMPRCPPQTPHAARTRTRAATVGSQRLTA
jgi:hypothetical protein